MPQLPSGTHVALNADRLLARLEENDFSLHMGLRMALREPADLLPLVNVVLFREARDGEESFHGIGVPYLSDLMAEDVGTPKCPWPAADQEFFRAWLDSGPAQQWLAATFEEVRELQVRARVELPDNLKGLFD